MYAIRSYYDDFVSKPIEPDQLWQALLRWIPPRQAAEPRRQPTSETSPTTPAPLPQLAGLDTQLGLSRVMGNRPLYLRLLEKFASSQQDCVARIRQALAHDDAPLAERLVHSLKGVVITSYSIHYTKLYEAATWCRPKGCCSTWRNLWARPRGAACG